MADFVDSQISTSFGHDGLRSAGHPYGGFAVPVGNVIVTSDTSAVSRPMNDRTNDGAPTRSTHIVAGSSSSARSARKPSGFPELRGLSTRPPMARATRLWVPGEGGVWGGGGDASLPASNATEPARAESDAMPPSASKAAPSETTPRAASELEIPMAI